MANTTEIGARCGIFVQLVWCPRNWGFDPLIFRCELAFDQVSEYQTIKAPTPNTLGPTSLAADTAPLLVRAAPPHTCSGLAAAE